MKVGIFQMPLHPPHRPLWETLEEDAARIILADQLKFDEVWIGEHFSATSEPVASPLMFMASLLASTSHVKFGTGVIGLPNHHPAIVAAEVAQFDHLSKGRLLFGIGPAGLSSDHELFENTDARARNEKLMESIDIILKIWSQDPPYDIAGKYWNVRIVDNIIPELGIGTMPKPYQQPYPPIAMSAMSFNSSSVKTAALRGFGPITASFSPEATAASHWAKYVEGCDESGRTANGADWRVVRNVVVGESDQQAEDWAFDSEGANAYYFNYQWNVIKRAGISAVMKSDPTIADSDVTTESLIKDFVIYGSAKTVREKLQAFREKVGPFGTLLIAGLDGSGLNDARERQSMVRLATDVVPALN